jgi:hypothetical protein
METIMSSVGQAAAMEKIGQEEEEAMIRMFPWESRKVGSTYAHEFQSLSEMSKSTGFEEDEILEAIKHRFGALGEYQFSKR